MSDATPEQKEDKKKLIDDMFHSWLISAGLGSDDNGIIHYRSKEGVLSGVVPPEEFRRLLEDPETGLVNKVKHLSPNIDYTLLWTPPELQEEAAQRVEENAAKSPSSK